MKNRSQKSWTAANASEEKKVADNKGLEELVVEQDEARQKASLAINFTNMNPFLNSAVESLKRRVGDKICSLSNENSNLIQEVKLKEKKLQEIVGVFDEFSLELDSKTLSLKRTKEELYITKEVLDDKINQLDQKDKDMCILKEDLDINKKEMSTVLKTLANTREDVIQGKNDFDILEHEHEINMEALESTKVALESVKDEITSTNIELLKTKRAYSAKFDTILKRAEDISNEKDTLELKLKDCNKHIDEQNSQLELLYIENKENRKTIEHFKIRSNGKIIDLESKVSMKDNTIDRLNVKLTDIDKTHSESITDLQKQIFEQTIWHKEQVKNENKKLVEITKRNEIMEKDHDALASRIEALELKQRQKDRTIVELLDSDETLNDEKENLVKKIEQLQLDLKWQTNRASGFVKANQALQDKLAKKADNFAKYITLVKSLRAGLDESLDVSTFLAEVPPVEMSKICKTVEDNPDTDMCPEYVELEDEASSYPDIPSTSSKRPASPTPFTEPMSKKAKSLLETQPAQEHSSSSISWSI